MAKNSLVLLFFFFNYTATTEIYTLSLHDALPIRWRRPRAWPSMPWRPRPGRQPPARDRKSTRLNSSHEWSSNAVFCLKKKKKILFDIFSKKKKKKKIKNIKNTERVKT